MITAREIGTNRFYHIEDEAAFSDGYWRVSADLPAFYYMVLPDEDSVYWYRATCSHNELHWDPREVREWGDDCRQFNRDNRRDYALRIYPEDDWFPKKELHFTFEEDADAVADALEALTTYRVERTWWEEE